MADILSWQRRLYPLLAPLGAAYGQAMRARREAYERGLLGSAAPAAPCVSVGNIGWGGAGKTPITDWLLTWAENQGLRPCVLTRGYKAVPPAPHYLVRPGTDPAACGDEPLMLAERHREASVVVDPKRARGAAWAAREIRPDLFIMDDGFQHLGLKRHFDVVLLRPEDLDEEWNRVIPSGSWREPVSALTRADVFLVKATPGEFADLAALARVRLECFGKPVFAFHLVPEGLEEVTGGRLTSPKPGETYVLMSATANPESIRRAVAWYMGGEPIQHLAYPDHHPYAKRDWLDARDAMIYNEAARVICTDKDAVKLKRFSPGGLYSLRVSVEFSGALFADTEFPGFWERAWAGLAG